MIILVWLVILAALAFLEYHRRDQHFTGRYGRAMLTVVYPLFFTFGLVATCVWHSLLPPIWLASLFIPCGAIAYFSDDDTNPWTPPVIHHCFVGGATTLVTWVIQGLVV